MIHCGQAKGKEAGPKWKMQSRPGAWQVSPGPPTPSAPASLSRATDTLSTLLAQQVRELNLQQRAARREGGADPGGMKGLKEATAVLKDLAAVAKTLNEQGSGAEAAAGGVVLLPAVEERT